MERYFCMGKLIIESQDKVFRALVHTNKGEGCVSRLDQTEVTAGDLKWNMVLDSRLVMLQWRGKHSMVSCDIQLPLFCVMAVLSYE